MSGLGDLWRRMTGAGRRPLHGLIHAEYRPDCPACREANAPVAYVPAPDFSSPTDLPLFTDFSSGSDASSSVDVPDSSPADTSAGFDGFDGGSSGGGGASGDW